MTADFQVTVIGGGVVGCSVLFGLAERGWTETLLLEKNELTSGSTWHAAGNCTHFGHDAEVTRLYVETLNVYQRAEEESGQSVSFHKTGSVRLATNQAELDAYQNLIPIYRKLGIAYNVLSPDEIASIHPLLNLDSVLGAAHTPDDGHVDASGATHAMAAASRARGAMIKRNSAVGRIEKLPSGLWRVETNDNTYSSKHLVIASSFWSREMAEQLKLDLPLYAMEHHEIITADHERIAQLEKELPTVRDPHIPSNTRQEGNGLLVGIYESEPVPWNIDGIPSEFGQELLVSNLDRLMPHLEKAMERMPILAESGIKKSNNGPICYTPDGLPMLGALQQHKNLWVAAGFSVGIGTGGGSGQFLAACMVDGQSPYQLPSVDPMRYAKPPSKSEAVKQIISHYAAGYAIPDSSKVVG